MVDDIGSRVFTIPAGVPFSKTLARFLLEETQGDAERLTSYRILLPTRRACRILRDTFLDLNEGAPLLLPQMRPIGDVDGDDLSLQMLGASDDISDIPPAITPLRRQLLLSRLIQKMPDFAYNADRALVLAKALGELMDQVVVEGLSFDNLSALVPEDFAQHWGITLEFLKIVSEVWPAILEEEGLIDAADRRNQLLRHYKLYLDHVRPDYPLIAAGTIGSIPAVADVLCSVARMPNGRVILPGLDTGLSAKIWEKVEDHHPQYFFKSLLRKMELEPEEVGVIGSAESTREGLARQMMLPAAFTHLWRDAEKPDNADDLNGLEYYACSGQEEEAAVIALIMREVLDDTERQKDVVALVTPDRRLARRVSALCRRWGVVADDSAGLSFDQSRLGVFCLLCLKAAQKPFDVVALLSFLKHPFCRMGYGHLEYQHAVNALERDVFRVRDKPIFRDLAHVKSYVDASDLPDFLRIFVDKVVTCFAHLQAVTTDAQDFGSVLRGLLQSLELFAARQTAEDIHRSGEEILWRGDAGEAGAQFFTDLIEQADLISIQGSSDCLALLTRLMRDVNVRSAYGVHPRVLILGQLEARLSHADVLILGGLNDGVWPSDQGHDPWMSRPMRSAFGLPATAQKVGLAAHDFVQGFCAERVIVTRSEKVDSSPTVMSPWLMRLHTVLQARGQGLHVLSKRPYRAWAQALDKTADVTPYKRPAPLPPSSIRLKRASVTKFTTWMENPYALYMYYILKLRAIEPLRSEVGAAQFGLLLHDVMDKFVAAYQRDLPDDVESIVMRLSQETVAEMLSEDMVPAYWLPRLQNVAAWFAQHEREWRTRAAFQKAEVSGRMILDVDGEGFEINGRADRIDLISSENGAGYALIDYKSAGTFSESKFKKGEYPQLPLEAMMLDEGGFSGLNAGSTQYLGYWKMTGGRQAGQEISLDRDIDAVVEIVRDAVVELIRTFRRADVPFYAVPDLSNAPRYDDYEHVSRLKEWAVLDDANGGDA